MNSVNATYAQNHFGQIVNNALTDDVILVEKHGKPLVYVISKKKYDMLQAIEDQYWLEKAEDGKKSGYLSHAESLELFDNLLGRKKKTRKAKGSTNAKSRNNKQIRKVFKKNKEKTESILSKLRKNC